MTVRTTIDRGDGHAGAVRLTDQVDALQLARQERQREADDAKIKAILARAEQARLSRPLSYQESKELNAAVAAGLQARKVADAKAQLDHEDLTAWAEVAGAQRAAEIAAEQQATRGPWKSEAQRRHEEAQLDEFIQRKVLSGYQRGPGHGGGR